MRYTSQLMDPKPKISGPKLLYVAPKWARWGGVSWSDEKNISDLDQKWIILKRCVFLVQSHQMCRSELENARGVQRGPFAPPPFRRSVWAHFKRICCQERSSSGSAHRDCCQIHRFDVIELKNYSILKWFKPELNLDFFSSDQLTPPHLAHFGA